jgi:hypothetical protein
MKRFNPEQDTVHGLRTLHTVRWQVISSFGDASCLSE